MPMISTSQAFRAVRRWLKGMDPTTRYLVGVRVVWADSIVTEKAHAEILALWREEVANDAPF